MRISVIVPAFNEEKLLGPTLAAIARATVAFAERGWTIELIVCDNNSTDRTAEVAVAAGARVVFEPVNQISRARNRGASVATGDWLLFVDADSQPSRALGDELADAIASRRVIACGATLAIDEAPFWFRAAARGWCLLSRVAGWMAGSFVAVEAAAFHAVGGFSTELYVAEEIDLSGRLKRHGRTLEPRRRVRILHRHPLLTSGRKAGLYGFGEHLRILGGMIRRPRRSIQARESCALWYDGRR